MIFENIPPNEQYTIKFTASILKILHSNNWNSINLKDWVKRNNQSIRVAIDTPIPMFQFD